MSYFGRSRCLVEFHKNATYAYRLWVHLPASQLFATLGFAKTTATLSVDWPLVPAPDILSDVVWWVCVGVGGEVKGVGWECV